MDDMNGGPTRGERNPAAARPSLRARLFGGARSTADPRPNSSQRQAPSSPPAGIPRPNSSSRPTGDQPPTQDAPDWRECYFEGDPIYFCCACGTPLGPDPEDTPDADGPGNHFCGECYRSREFDIEQQFEHGLWTG
jgi:hypothetical protein